MRLAEIADILAPHEHMESDGLHSVMRGPAFLILMAAQPGRGRTSPAEYRPEEIARARLLLAARNCGLIGPDLARFNDALNQPPSPSFGHPDSAKSEGGFFYPSGLLSIIRGAHAGEDWQVAFRFTRAADGNRRVAAVVFWAGGQPADSGKGARTLDLLHDETHIGTTTIPASDLIRPLLDHLKG